MLGSVVDNEIMNRTLGGFRAMSVSNVTIDEFLNPIPDLRTQVQQWLHFEKRQYGAGRVQNVERANTVFIVYFSLWDIWYYSKGDLSSARAAVRSSTDALFQQLDVIAENWAHDLKIIVPRAIDITFLPAWHRLRTGPTGEDAWADDQRKAVLLVEQWNTALDHRASYWKSGQMYIYDANEWFLNQVLEQQLLSQKSADASGLGTRRESWQNVLSGCVISEDRVGESAGIDRNTVRCSNPTNHLFW